MAILKLKDENGNVFPVPALIGEKGDTGEKGEKGDTGEAGYTPIKGIDYFDGHTPVKGTDYFTEADKEELVAELIANLPVYNGEVVTE